MDREREGRGLGRDGMRRREREGVEEERWKDDRGNGRDGTGHVMEGWKGRRKVMKREERAITAPNLSHSPCIGMLTRDNIHKVLHLRSYP